MRADETLHDDDHCWSRDKEEWEKLSYFAGLPVRWDNVTIITMRPAPENNVTHSNAVWEWETRIALNEKMVLEYCGDYISIKPKVNPSVKIEELEKQIIKLLKRDSTRISFDSKVQLVKDIRHFYNNSMVSTSPIPNDAEIMSVLRVMGMLGILMIEDER